MQFNLGAFRRRQRGPESVQNFIRFCIDLRLGANCEEHAAYERKNNQPPNQNHPRSIDPRSIKVKLGLLLARSPFPATTLAEYRLHNSNRLRHAKISAPPKCQSSLRYPSKSSLAKFATLIARSHTPPSTSRANCDYRSLLQKPSRNAPANASPRAPFSSLTHPQLRSARSR